MAKNAASFTSFTAAPKQRLQLLDIQLGSVARLKDWSEGKESNREKKRRRWKEIQKKKKEGQKDETEFRGWMYLPDLILEHIFKFLTYRERKMCSMTCFTWSLVFNRRSIWAHLTIFGDTMCTWRYNCANMEHQAQVDTMRVSKALNAIGEKLQCLSFLPTENLHNIVTFQNCITRFCYVNHKKLPNIRCFTYKFPCDFARRHDEVEIFGTGGMILQNMKDLLQCLPGLERLELIDLQLTGTDAEHALDEVGDVCRFSLQTLKIVNISRLPFSMMAVQAFRHLRCLIISPHNLGDDLVEALAGLEVWSDEFYSWVKKSSRTYKDVEREVSQVLGFRWYALNDKQFKLTSVNLNFQYYYEGFEETGKC